MASRHGQKKRIHSHSHGRQNRNIVQKKRSSAAPVGGHLYYHGTYPYPQLNHHHHHHHHHVPVHHTVAYNWCTWLIVFAFLAILITWTVLAFTVPVQSHPHTYKSDRNAASLGVGPVSRLLSANKRTEGHCHLGEKYDKDLQMCAPKINIPMALDSEIMDPNVPSCDSFFHSMCGRWIDQHTNEDRSFSYGYRKNMHHIHKLITSPDSGPVHDFYRSCVDTLVDDSRKAHKESIIEQKHVLGRILGGLRLHSDLPTVFGHLTKAGYTAPFILSIERHPNKNELVPLLMWDGFQDDGGKTFNKTIARAIYERSKEVTKYSDAEIETRISRLLRITSQMSVHNTAPLSVIQDYVSYARGVGSRRLSEDLTTVAKLPAWKALADKYRGRCSTCVNEGWNRFFQATGGQGLRFEDTHEVWMVDEDYFTWLLEEGLTHFDIKEWQAFVEFSILYNSHQFAPSLPSDVYFRQHDVHGPVGSEGRVHHRLARSNHIVSKITESDCVRVTNAMIPGLVARQFLDKYVDNEQQIRTEVLFMMRGIIEAFVTLIQETEWMDELTKERSIEKLRAIKIRVIEPDTWIPEPFGNRISADRWDHNMNMVRRYRVQQNLGLWHKDTPLTLDKSAIAFFAMPLMSINAYYSGISNSITILNGVLQHPFYNQEYDIVSKYAILGAILGHELTHSLDNNGINFDKDGRVPPKGWWSNAAFNMFQSKLQCIMDEFGAPAGCEEDNLQYGASTIGEDMADLVGLKLAYRALFSQSSQGRKLTQQHKQHFFMIWSQLWCESLDQKHKCDRVKHDVHAFAEYRVDKTARELAEWQEAFGCHHGQLMYKKKQKQCIPFGNRHV